MSGPWSYGWLLCSLPFQGSGYKVISGECWPANWPWRLWVSWQWSGRSLSTGTRPTWLWSRSSCFSYPSGCTWHFPVWQPPLTACRSLSGPRWISYSYASAIWGCFCCSIKGNLFRKGNPFRLWRKRFRESHSLNRFLLIHYLFKFQSGFLECKWVIFLTSFDPPFPDCHFLQIHAAKQDVQLHFNLCWSPILCIPHPVLFLRICEYPLDCLLAFLVLFLHSYCVTDSFCLFHTAFPHMTCDCLYTVLAFRTLSLIRTVFT